MKQLIESGEKERLMELLRERLVECGWKDEMKAICRWVFASALIFLSNYYQFEALLFHGEVLKI